MPASGATDRTDALMPRWLPLAATALVAILAVIGVGLWKFDVLRTTRIENGGRPAVPACDPANAVGKAVLPECPQNAFPNPRSP
ncbi:MAG TPA: hypothetical protein VF641_03120 [Methylobacterium sp.]